jgi:hypothetical protein
MKLLCLIGLHLWTPDTLWASRVCRTCAHIEVLRYTKESGTYWERVS